MDRAAQKAGTTYSGVAGFASQDASLQESMGPICDRTKENLVSTDNGIIMARHRLMRAAKALVEKGTIPPEAVEQALARIRTAGDAQAAAGADIAVEAVSENPQIKFAVFQAQAFAGAPDISGQAGVAQCLDRGAIGKA